jgi:hypothetical protein
MIKRQLARTVVRCALLISLTSAIAADAGKQIPVDDATFKCLAEMTPVRGFFVANLLGRLDDTVKVAKSPTGGKYPPGSVIQLVPGEAMVKHHEGWNPETKDWEFFELTNTEAGTRIKVRGTKEVVNRFGGNCFACHSVARPEWDLVCESDHGCAPLPIKREQIVGIQQADPRCKRN